MRARNCSRLGQSGYDERHHPNIDHAVAYGRQRRACGGFQAESSPAGQVVGLANRITEIFSDPVEICCPTPIAYASLCEIYVAHSFEFGEFAAYITLIRERAGWPEPATNKMRQCARGRTRLTRRSQARLARIQRLNLHIPEDVYCNG